MNLLFAPLLDLLLVSSDQGAGPQARPAHNQMDMFFTVSVDSTLPFQAIPPGPPLCRASRNHLGAGHSTEGAGGALGSSWVSPGSCWAKRTMSPTWLLAFLPCSTASWTIAGFHRTLLQSLFYCGTNRDTISFCGTRTSEGFHP